MAIVADGFFFTIDNYDIFISRCPARSVTEFARVDFMDLPDYIQFLLVGEILISGF